VARHALRVHANYHEGGTPQGVDVPLGPVEAGGNLEELDSLGGDDVTGSSRRDFTVAGVLEQWRPPAELELRSSFDQSVGPVEGDDETGLGIDEVRILRRFGERYYVHAIRADVPRHR